MVDIQSTPFAWNENEHESICTLIDYHNGSSPQHSPAPPSEAPTEEWMTVFVHGIMSVRPHISLGNIIRLMLDQVQNTSYARTVGNIRKDPFFCKNQAMQGYGLQKIKTECRAKGYAPGALSLIFEEMTQEAYPDKKIKNIFYTFGWSGIISPKTRKKAGLQLYHELEQEIKRVQSLGYSPKIRIIGYSHGGNVALNLGTTYSKNHNNHSYHIDELVLVGTPIQGENDHLIESNLFKLIYNIYSQADRIQALDFFSFKRFFSQKIFKSRPGFKLPKKLTQIQIKVTEKVRSSFGKKQADTNATSKYTDTDILISGKARFLRDVSPGHSELWFFGWTPQYYRQNFPLYPLPTITMIPHIIRHIEQFKDNISPEKTIVADLRPHYAHMIIHKENDYREYSIVPFPSHQKIVALGNKAALYTPDDYTKKAYTTQVSNACQEAKIYTQKLRSKN